MRKIMNKKIAAVALGAVAITGTGVAYAYWTTTGAGTGAASSRTVEAGESVVLSQDVVIDGLYPGAPAKDIKVKAVNPAPYDQEVGEVSVDVSYPTNCPASNWALTETTSEFGLLKAVNAGTTDQAIAVVGTFRLIETGLNQDLCKSQTPTFAFSSLIGASDARTPVTPVQ